MDLVTAITQFPTVIFTILLGISLGYWLLVIVGAAGIDAFDGAGEGVSHGVDSIAGGMKAAGGAADALTGGMKAAGSAADSLLGGAKAVGSVGEGLHAGAKAAGHALGEVHSGTKASGGMFAALGFGKVPLTISGSLILFFSFLACTLLMGAATEKLPHWDPLLLKFGVFFAALLSGTLVASICARPLKKIFETQGAIAKTIVLGKLAHVTSLTVDAKQGVVEFQDGGAGLILHATCEKKNSLKKGDPVVIVSYDRARDVYEVEPADWIMGERISEQLSADDVDAHARQKDPTR